MSPNERPFMTSYPSLIINLAVSARVTKLQPSEICLGHIMPGKYAWGILVPNPKPLGLGANY